MKNPHWIFVPILLIAFFLTNPRIETFPVFPFSGSENIRTCNGVRQNTQKAKIVQRSHKFSTPAQVTVRLFSITSFNKAFVSSSSKIILTCAESSASKEQLSIMCAPEGKLLVVSLDGEKKHFISPLTLKSSSPITITPFGGKSRTFQSPIFIANTGKQLIISGRYSLEEYIAGVVAGEMPHNAGAALPALAIVARSFAIKNIGRHWNDGYDFCDSTHCQFFAGYVGRNSPYYSAAMDTQGMVLIYRGEIVEGFYHSTCGGHTSDALGVLGMKIVGIMGIRDVKDKGYQREDSSKQKKKDGEGGQESETGKQKLQMGNGKRKVRYGTKEEINLTLKDTKNKTIKSSASSVFSVNSATGLVLCQDSPHFYWKYRLLKKYLLEIMRKEPKYSSIDSVRALKIEEKDNAGRVVIIKIIGNNKIYSMSGYEFWQMLGSHVGWGKIKSTLFDIKDFGDYIEFYGRGLGHGMGLCQWGAIKMAKMGYDYYAILRHYFPEAQVRRY